MGAPGEKRKVKIFLNLISTSLGERFFQLRNFSFWGFNQIPSLKPLETGNPGRNFGREHNRFSQRGIPWGVKRFPPFTTFVGGPPIFYFPRLHKERVGSLRFSPGFNWEVPKRGRGYFETPV